METRDMVCRGDPWGKICHDLLDQKHMGCTVLWPRMAGDAMRGWIVLRCRQHFRPLGRSWATDILGMCLMVTNDYCLGQPRQFVLMYCIHDTFRFEVGPR